MELAGTPEVQLNSIYENALEQFIYNNQLLYYQPTITTRPIKRTTIRIIHWLTLPVTSSGEHTELNLLLESKDGRTNWTLGFSLAGLKRPSI
jgi:hypothetical protein